MSRNAEQYFRNVRTAVAKWKHSQLQASVKEDQDTSKLNDFLRQTAIVYHVLKDYLDSKDAPLSDESLSGILNAIGDKRELSYEDRMILQDYLLHDLMEYPFTYNTSLINSFQPTNILNTNIVPNK
jgi:hypothetical protein